MRRTIGTLGDALAALRSASAVVPATGRRLAAATVGVLLAATTVGAAAAPEAERSAQQAAAPPYITLLFSRSQWVPALNCTALPNTVTIRALATELQARGLRGTGTVVTRQTQETGRLCLDDLDVDGNVLRPGGVLYGSWADLAMLRNTYRWRFVSHSRTYRDMTAVTPVEQRDEACGSLADLRAHGHQRGDGLFSYPNNRFTDAIQRDVVASCFAYGRKYGVGLNKRSTTTSPWFQQTVSVNGGNCNLVSLPCYTFTAPRRYASPVGLGDRLAAVKPDEWFVMQHYRFVTGSLAGRWDCRAADWRRHWTSSAEEYCWNDYRSILDRIPSSAVVTDPKTVAVAWGRTGY
jgi:hypothetical protein